jgi:hypothetical protein
MLKCTYEAIYRRPQFARRTHPEKRTVLRPRTPPNADLRIGYLGVALITSRQRSNRVPGKSRMRILEIPKSGRLGKWVYYMRGRKQCRRRWVKPRDPRTPGQLRSRARFGAASRAWSWSQRLTEELRQEWRVAGAKVRSRPRLWQSGKLTGQAYFVGRNCAKARIGLDLLTRPSQGSHDDQIIVTPVTHPAVRAFPRQAAVRGGCLQARQCQRVARSTWDQYHTNTGVAPYQCRRNTSATARARSVAGGVRKPSLAGVQRHRRRRELWRGS